MIGLALTACGEPGAETPREGAGTPPPSSGPAAPGPEGSDPAAEALADPAAAPAGGGRAEAPEAEPAAEATALATLCERARACCAAYVAAIPSSRRPVEERACTEMDRVLGAAGDGSDEACEAAIGGWRVSLQLTGLEVPAACLE